jgi:hypothetical protein
MMALHWGLGGSLIDGNPTRVDSLVIRWLSGQVDRYYDIPADTRYIATEGEGINLAAPREAVSFQPSAFSLSAHPNPFNSQLMVEFAPVKRGRVMVEAYDLSGRRVAVLADENFSAGMHRLTWDAGSLPAGSYLIQARYEGGMASRVVVLAR